MIRKGRRFTRRKNRGKSKTRLQGAPQRAGVVTRTTVIKPKKPNSANRPVVRVRLSNGIEVAASPPGEGHNLQEHSTVLIRGGRRPDLPGVRHIVVRGNRDLSGVQPKVKSGMGSEPIARKNARSKYGVKKTK